MTSVVSKNVFLDTAYAKNKDDSRWYYFDDSSVSESQEESVCVSCSTFLLPTFILLISLFPP